uniref:Uncharacterized protein n=1 Tax=Rhizophora mucronata TaxID=61149 RepID=A0A2P2ILY7_RHIMU
MTGICDHNRIILQTRSSKRKMNENQKSYFLQIQM